VDSSFPMRLPGISWVLYGDAGDGYRNDNGACSHRTMTDAPAWTASKSLHAGPLRGLASPMEQNGRRGLSRESVRTPYDIKMISRLGINVYPSILPKQSHLNIDRSAHNHDDTSASTAKDLFRDLRQLGFTNEDIKDLAAMRQGITTLADLRETYGPLRGLGYEHGDLVSIACCGGSAALRAVIKSHEQCTAGAFSRGDVVTIAACPGGAQALLAVAELHEKLTSCGYSKADITLVCKSRFAGEVLRIIVDRHEALESRGLRKDDILEISKGPRAALVLKAKLGNTTSRHRAARAKPMSLESSSA